MNQMNNISQKFEIKAKGDAGKFVAYGNVFGVIDNNNDVTIKGAFTETINRHLAAGTMPKFCEQHGHTKKPLGIITSMVEDEKGLKFEGEFCLETQDGRENYALVKQGALDEFSIGFVTVQSENQIIQGQKVRALQEVDVLEISLVTFACNPESKIQEIKSAIESKNDVTPRMVQKALQESGLSKRQAECAINQIKTEIKNSELDEQILKDNTVTKEKSQKAEIKSAEENVETKSTEQVVEKVTNSVEQKANSTQMEVKAGWYMRECLEDPIVSLNCVYNILNYLPPSAHAAIIEAAEAGRVEQLAKLGMLEEKSSDQEVETKADEEVEEEVETEESEEETKTDKEDKESDEEESDEDGDGEKETEVKFSAQDIESWLSQPQD